MKKILISLTSLLLIFLSSCFPTVEQAPPIGSVGVLFPLDDENTRWLEEYDVLRQFLASQNYAVYFARTKENDGVQQAEMIRQVDEIYKVQYIILATVDAYSTQINDALANFVGRGGRVILYDRLQQNTAAVEVLISNSYMAIGELQYTALANLPMGSKVEMIAGPTYDNNAKTLYAGAYESLSAQLISGNWTCPSNKTEYKDVKMESWSKDAAFERMKAILTEHYADKSFPDAVLVGNDTQASGVIDALKAHNTGATKLPIITGLDNTNAAWARIKGNEQTMTVFKNPAAIIKKVSELLSQMLKGESLSPSHGYVNNGAAEVPYFEIGDLKAVYLEDIKEAEKNQ